jgi:hypothetical protein
MNDRIDSVPGADDSFETADVDARIVGDVERSARAFGKAVQPAGVLQRIARRQQPPHAIKLQALQRKQADGAMRRVRRIERAAEQAYAHALGVEGDGLRGGLQLHQPGHRVHGAAFTAASARCRERDT